MVIYRIGKSEVSSVRQVEELLRSAESGAAVEFIIGIIRAAGQNREVATVRLTARQKIWQRNCSSVVSSKYRKMIKVENLTKGYAGQPAIRDLNFAVSQGEIMGC